VKITILSENYVPPSLGLMGEHGYSVLIEKNGISLLFDTGQHGICVDNALTLGCDLRKIERILLSHGHYDHCGGLERVLKTIGRPVEIIGHSSIFDKKYAIRPEFGEKHIGIRFEREYIESILMASFHFQNGFYEVGKGIWLTGEVPFSNDFEKIPDDFAIKRNGRFEKDQFMDDNSLLIDTDKGLVVILGCAHRGMMNILSYIKKKLKKNIHAVIGGTHLFGAKKDHLEFVKDFIRKEDIKLFAPSHCTGIDKIMEFSRELPDVTKPAFCGTIFEF